MSTYNEFSIQEVIADLSQKRIVIKTNFKVDPDSVLPTNIAFYNYDETTLEKYQLITDNKIIYVILDDYPKDGARYYLKVKDLRDALGRTLKTHFDDYIIFESDIKTKLQIINPKSRETLRSQTISINIKAERLALLVFNRNIIKTIYAFTRRNADMKVFWYVVVFDK